LSDEIPVICDLAFVWAALRRMFVRLVAVNAGLVSMAARSKLDGMSNAPRVSDVMSSLIATLQQRGSGDAEMSQLLSMIATPGATDSLNDALQTAISEIEGSVEPMIKSAHEETQQAIDERISALESSTGKAVERKQTANTEDDEWFNCVRDEKAKKEAVEDAETALQNSRNSETVACQLQEDRKDFSWKSSEVFEFSCNFASDGTCDSQLATFESQMNDMLSGLRSELDESVRLYEEAAAGCEQAKADTVAKQNAREGADTAWEAQREVCFGKHESREVSMCLFGEELQRKCGEVTAYDDLLAQVDKVNGGVHSHADRVSEWTTMRSVTCQLRLIMNGAALDQAAIDNCKASVNYDSDVGTLRRREDERAALTTADQFTCAETSIAFRGETWEIGGEPTPSSSDYVVVDWTPAVSLSELSPAFDFCQAEGPGK